MINGIDAWFDDFSLFNGCEMVFSILWFQNHPFIGGIPIIFPLFIGSRSEGSSPWETSSANSPAWIETLGPFNWGLPGWKSDVRDGNSTGIW
jgi:hypothetical protein